MFLVAIGDVVDSRLISNRKAFQADLGASVTMVNRLDHRESGALVSPYTITLGDEVQSVYHRFSSAVLDIMALQACVWPVRMRFCLGLGELTTKLNRRAAIGMDGPAFHCARAGIEEMKRNAAVHLGVMAQAGVDVDLEDSAIKLIDDSIAGWRHTRFKVFLETLRSTDVPDIAARIGISTAAVYKNLSDGRVALLTRAARAIGLSLEHKKRPPKNNRLNP